MPSSTFAGKEANAGFPEEKDAKPEQKPATPPKSTTATISFACSSSKKGNTSDGGAGF